MQTFISTRMRFSLISLNSYILRTAIYYLENRNVKYYNQKVKKVGYCRRNLILPLLNICLELMLAEAKFWRTRQAQWQALHESLACSFSETVSNLLPETQGIRIHRVLRTFASCRTFATLELYEQRYISLKIPIYY